LEKSFFFRTYIPPKIGFFTNYTTWQTSNFYSTGRVDPDAPLEMKIKKKKKEIFVREIIQLFPTKVMIAWFLC
jgi:hypothetical protein